MVLSFAPYTHVGTGCTHSGFPWDNFGLVPTDSMWTLTIIYHDLIGSSRCATYRSQTLRYTSFLGALYTMRSEDAITASIGSQWDPSLPFFNTRTIDALPSSSRRYSTTGASSYTLHRILGGPGWLPLISMLTHQIRATSGGQTPKAPPTVEWCNLKFPLSLLPWEVDRLYQDRFGVVELYINLPILRASKGPSPDRSRIGCSLVIQLPLDPRKLVNDLSRVSFIRRRMLRVSLAPTSPQGSCSQTSRWLQRAPSALIALNHQT